MRYLLLIVLASSFSIPVQADVTSSASQTVLKSEKIKLPHGPTCDPQKIPHSQDWYL